MTARFREARQAMRRTLVWIDEPRFLGWGCAECAWVFNPSGPPSGDSIEDMTRQYEQQRTQDFAAHICAGQRRPKDSGPRT